jgi:two-component system sensor histidine kinase KdpD
MQTEASPAVQFTERFKPWQRVGLTILACGGTTLLATPLLDHLDLANIVMLFCSRFC